MLSAGHWGKCPFEGRNTDGLPEHQAPEPLADFLARWPCLEPADETSVYLYHGTNCYRRWEINRTGALVTGRSGYSFYCNTAAEAHSYAKAACLRDIGPHAANSLIAEPVVLKVRFTARSWLQVDFIQSHETLECDALVTIAVVGPISSNNIVEVLNCNHSQRRTAVRSFADGSLKEGIKRLRSQAGRWRLDAWFLRKLEHCSRSLEIWLSGKPPVEVTHRDCIHRLTQAGPR